MSDGTSGVRWVIDPLDGTTNYLYGHPSFAVSIAAELDGRAVAGVVVDVPTGDVFRATGGRRGHPRRRAHRRVGRADLSQALVATGFGYRPDQRRHQAAVLAAILDQIRDIRRMGSAALDLCSVACGRVDAYYEFVAVTVGLRRRCPHRHRGRRRGGGSRRPLPGRRSAPRRTARPGEPTPPAPPERPGRLSHAAQAPAGAESERVALRGRQPKQSRNEWRCAGASRSRVGTGDAAQAPAGAAASMTPGSAKPAATKELHRQS